MRSTPAAGSNEGKLVRIGGRSCHLAGWVLFIVYISFSASAFVSVTWWVKSTCLQVYKSTTFCFGAAMISSLQFNSGLAWSRWHIAALNLAWGSCILNHAYSALADRIMPSTDEDDDKCEHALPHEMLIDEFDSIFEKRWTLAGANGEFSAT
jgi:hypothetical protein